MWIEGSWCSRRRGTDLRALLRRDASRINDVTLARCSARSRKQPDYKKCAVADPEEGGADDDAGDGASYTKTEGAQPTRRPERLDPRRGLRLRACRVDGGAVRRSALRARRPSRLPPGVAEARAMRARAPRLQGEGLPAMTYDEVRGRRAALPTADLRTRLVRQMSRRSPRVPRPVKPGDRCATSSARTFARAAGGAARVQRRASDDSTPD